jgi:hypothetical protein
MPTVPDDMLMAYVDGELDEIARGRLERALADDPALGTAAETQRRLKARLSQHYDPIADEEVPERFRSMLEGKVADIAAARERRRAWLDWRRLAAVAATFVAGVLAAQLIPEAAERDGSAGGPLFARASLSEALDTRLASTQSADASTRIGVSFAAKDGRLCRSFETRDLAGLACRDGGEWELLTMVRVSGGTEGQYRQAGSGSALVMQVAQELIMGQPFDAAAERRARDGGWRRSGLRPEALPAQDPPGRDPPGKQR